MDRIRDSAFFTTLLHCVLAYSLPSDNLAYKPGPHNIVSSIPNSGILQTPSFDDKTPQPSVETPFIVHPSWPSSQANPNSDLDDKVKNHPPSYNLPGTALKGMGLKYPLTMPRVKLNFVGTSGMLPVNTQHKPLEKPEPQNKELEPAVSDLSSKSSVSNRLVNSIKEWLGMIKPHNNIKPPSSKHNHSKNKAEVKADKLDNPPTYPSVLYDQAKLPPNTFQLTPPPKPELPDVYLYPTNFNYPQTIPEMDYGKGQEAQKPVTPSYKYFLPGLVSGFNPYTDYPTSTVLNYGGNLPERDNKDIPYGANEPETATLEHKKGIHLSLDESPIIQLTKPNKADQSGVLKPTNFDYISTEPGVKKDVAIELPPVPTTMSVKRRTQLVLLNTAAGLPGGNTQALAALSAG